MKDKFQALKFLSRCFWLIAIRIIQGHTWNMFTLDLEIRRLVRYKKTFDAQGKCIYIAENNQLNTYLGR